MCPKCRGYFAGHLLCPNCGVQLAPEDDPESDVTTLANRIRKHFPALQAPFVRRFFLGLLIAQGLYYGIRQFTLAAAQLFGAAWGFSELLIGPMIGLAFQLGALFFAALVAGAGHTWAVALGATLGAVNSAAILGAAYHFKAMPEGLFLYGHAPLHLVVGIMGGLFGRILFRPLQDLPLLQDAAPPAPPPRPVLKKDLGPIAWARVLAGAVLAFTGTVWAHTLRSQMGGGSGGFNGQFITW